MIHILYGMTDLNGRFAKYPATSICSVLENSRSEIQFHLIHDSTLTDSNREKLIELVSKYDQSIQFYNVDEIFPDRIESLRNRYEKIPKMINWAFGALYRLLAPELIDLPKIIYFDTDILVNLDVAELWKIDLGNYPIAAKLESNAIPNVDQIPPEIDLFESNPKKICDALKLVKRENYFASDVMIYNLDLIRKIFAEENATLIDSSLEILQKFPLQYIDQDALNFLFSETYLHLPAKFNVFVGQMINFYDLMHSDLKIENWIYHFSGYNQDFDRTNNFSRLWFKYFSKTPFFDSDSIFNLAEHFQNLIDYERKKTQWIFKISKSMKIIAFANREKFADLKRFFYLEDEFMIEAGNSNQKLREIFDLMRHGDKFLLVFVSYYESLRDFLIQCGFKENEHFIDGRHMIPREQDGILEPDRVAIYYM